MNFSFCQQKIAKLFFSPYIQFKPLSIQLYWLDHFIPMHMCAVYPPKILLFLWAALGSSWPMLIVADSLFVFNQEDQLSSHSILTLWKNLRVLSAARKRCKLSHWWAELGHFILQWLNTNLFWCQAGQDGVPVYFLHVMPLASVITQGVIGSNKAF